MEKLRQNLVIEDLDPSGKRRIRAFESLIIEACCFGTPLFYKETEEGRQRIPLGVGYRIYSFEGYLKDKYPFDLGLMAQAVVVATDAARSGGHWLPFDTKIRGGHI